MIPRAGQGVAQTQMFLVAAYEAAWCLLHGKQVQPNTVPTCS